MENKTLDAQHVKVALKYYQCCGTEVADQAASLLKSGDYLGLVSMTIDPSDYTNADAYFRDACAISLLRKCDFDIPGVDKTQACKDLFMKAEKQCYDTNVRFSRYLNNGPFEGLEELKCLEFLETARAWIAKTLKGIPDSLKCRFGPGSTFDDRSPLATVSDKMTSKPTVTSEAAVIADFHYRGTAWDRARVTDARVHYPEIVRGNRFAAVPKDALKYRGACIEPSLNVFCQLGAGDAIRNRLRREANIDIERAEGVHREWARQASLDGKHATIDLSMASDTIARLLVKWLIPTDWYDLLDSLRSPNTFIGEKWVRNEKFSSMGNGFTFELETLIFASICFAAGAGQSGTDFSVYGDDMIVPTSSAKDVLAMLSFCGFTPNRRKTFISGPFRESCGGDYFMGVAVRPYFLKELPNAPEQWISMANGIRRMVVTDCDRHFNYSFPFTAWLRCLDAIPSAIRRLRGPKELGDLVIHDSTFERRWRGGIGYVRVYRPVNTVIPWVHWTPSVMLATILYGPASPWGVTPRDGVTGYKIGYSAFS